MRYYIEKDGQVFLVEKDGKLTLPSSKDEVPFPFEEVRPLALKSHDVTYCTPKIDYQPSWTHKDEVPAMENVDSLVRLAVNRTLVRHVSDAIIYRDGKVLMVKASRGLAQNIWDLPGGFITYGESPEESLVREIKEEIGVEVTVKKLLHVNTNVVGDLYFTAFIYLCDVPRDEPVADPSEIAAVDWIPIDQAIKETTSFVRDSLERFKREEGI